MRRKRKKKKIILLSFVFVIGVIAVWALYGNQGIESTYLAEEYFDISDVAYEGFFQSNGSVLAVHILEFNLTAVGGDAHQVRIPNLAIDEPDPVFPKDEYVDLGNMLQGEAETVKLTTERGVYVRLEEEGFPIKIRIISKETFGDPIDQFITIYLTEEEKVNK